MCKDWLGSRREVRGPSPSPGSLWRESPSGGALALGRLGVLCSRPQSSLCPGLPCAARSHPQGPALSISASKPLQY